MTIEEREKEISELTIRYKKTWAKLARLNVKKLPKDPEAVVARGWRIVQLAMEASINLAHIANIRSNPIPKYPPGAQQDPRHPALVGRGDKEYIILRDGKLILGDPPALMPLPAEALQQAQ